MNEQSDAIAKVDSESTSQLGPGKILENGLGFDRAVVRSGRGSANSKKENEDYYWPHPADKTSHHLIDYLIAGRLYVVADGVSRGLRGDEASQLATKTIAETYYEEVFKLEHYPEEAELVAALKTALLRADQTLLKESQNRHSQADSTDTGGYLQTTAICAVLRGERLILASVGDSRCYRLRKNEMDRTNPPQVDLLRVEASGEENKFFLGANLRPSQISLFSQALTPEDMLLLCTDGLYKYLAPDNDPKSTPIMIQDNWGYYSSGGIQRLGYELFSQADDPTTYGGQDNITLLLVEPPQPAAMPVNEAIEQWAAFAWWNVDQLWRFEGSGSAAREKLQALCHKQAQSFSRAGNPAEREMWEHRAKQLGSTVSSGWAEFQRARELYEKLGLDFRENRKNVVTIFALYDQTSENSDLRQLGLHAVTDLANLALMSYPDNGEFLWDVYRLFDPFYTRVAPNIAEEEKETALKILKQVALNLSRAAIILVKGNANDNLDNRTVDVYAKSMVGTIIRYRDQGVYSLTYTQFIDVLKTEKMPVLSKVPPTSSLAFSVEPIASPDVKPENSQLSLPTTQLVDDEVASPYTPKKSQSIMRNLLLVVFLIMAIGFGRIVILQLLNGNTLLATVLRGTPTPVTTNEPVTVTLLPTKTATPVPTTTPTGTPPSTVASPDIQIGAPQFGIQTPTGGRKQVEIALPLSLTLPAAFTDVDAVLEVQTFTSAGLSPVGGVPDPTFPTTPSAPLVQRIPLTALNLNDIVFELLYVVEPPRVANPGYAMTVTATLVGSDGKSWVKTTSQFEPFIVPHQPGLTITQVIMPAIVGIGEPFTYHLTIQNTGETYIEQIQLNWDASTLSVQFENSGVWQAYLDTIRSLAPGESKEVEIGTSIAQAIPATFETSLALIGILADGQQLSLPQQPISLTLYAEGITVRPPPSCTNCMGGDAAPVYVSPTQYSALLARLDFALVVRVFDVQRVRDEIWYYIETVIDEQLIRGWIWSERVQLNDPTLAQYLRENTP